MLTTDAGRARAEAEADCFAARAVSRDDGDRHGPPGPRPPPRAPRRHLRHQARASAPHPRLRRHRSVRLRPPIPPAQGRSGVALAAPVSADEDLRRRRSRTPARERSRSRGGIIRTSDIPETRLWSGAPSGSRPAPRGPRRTGARPSRRTHAGQSRRSPCWTSSRPFARSGRFIRRSRGAPSRRADRICHPRSTPARTSRIVIGTSRASSPRPAPRALAAGVGAGAGGDRAGGGGALRHRPARRRPRSGHRLRPRQLPGGPRPARRRARRRARPCATPIAPPAPSSGSWRCPREPARTVSRPRCATECSRSRCPPTGPGAQRWISRFGDDDGGRPPKPRSQLIDANSRRVTSDAIDSPERPQSLRRAPGMQCLEQEQETWIRR